MSSLNVYKTYIHVAVNVVYETLPAANGFPEQVDIKRIVLDRKNKGRPVELLRSMDEGDVIALEDAVLEETQGVRQRLNWDDAHCDRSAALLLARIGYTQPEGT
jgi:hypothetical protein